MEQRNKPQGGFRFIEAFELLWVYFAFKQGLIRWHDLRIWFACHEAVARRCGAKKGVPAKYREEEIQRLVGGAGVQCVRRGLKRLQNVGLLSWSSEAINFGKARNDIRPEGHPGFQTMVEEFGQTNRNVPVPRRTIRRIAAGTRKVETATMLGLVMRCCYFRRGVYASEGSCSASWIARVFGLDERNVKMARKQLVRIGWLLPAKADAWHQQRFGGRAIVNPEWGGAGRRDSSYLVARYRPQLDAAKRSPRKSHSEVKRSPLLNLKENSFGSKNQKPASAADQPSGFHKSKKIELGIPTLKRLGMEDLRDIARTLVIFGEAAERGFVRNTEADRLKVVGAAERAMRVGTKNACGLFFELIRSNLWHHINQAEEERARRRLQRHAFGNDGSGGLQMPKAAQFRKALSLDAQIVGAVKRTVVAHRLKVDPFQAVCKERPDWSQERWAKAEAELANWGLVSCRVSASTLEQA